MKRKVSLKCVLYTGASYMKKICPQVGFYAPMHLKCKASYTPVGSM